MQYGPVLSCSVELPPPPFEADNSKAKTAVRPAGPLIAAKALVIKFSDGSATGATCFDTELLRMAAGWTNGFLDLKKTNIGSYKGTDTGAAVVAGDVMFSTKPEPAWRVAGELAQAAGHYSGFYLHGERVILSYQVDGCEVLESPELLCAGSERVLLRRFTMGLSKKALQLVIANVEQRTGGTQSARRTFAQSEPKPQAGYHGYMMGDGSQRLAVAVAGEATPKSEPAAEETSALPIEIGESDENALFISIPALTTPTSFTVAIWKGAESSFPAESVFTPRDTIDLRKFCKGGEMRWPQAITEAGVRGKDDAAYVIDTLPVPEDNPWKSWMRISAFDFFPDGRAAVATLNGDVWIISGLDEKLELVAWKRFAVGLYEPLGLKIVDGRILVHGRDGITRLHDLNGDGEADFYEAFNRDRPMFPSYHAFAFDLDSDRAGNLYYVVGGNWMGKDPAWGSCVVQVSADGKKLEVVATGFRAPNGLAVGPNDEIVVSDNQGSWVPASKISIIRPGGFYGHVADPRVEPRAVAPPGFDAPICYIPMALDNSSGGAVWVRGGKWGPFEGHLLHTSYGSASLFAVMQDRVGEVVQGGAVKFPLKFASGIMRARFNPQDGQLYVAGLKGWQTSAAKDGCFQRVRYTGEPLRMPTALRVGKDSLSIEFPIALDPATANDPQSYGIEQWNYQWWSTYGSPDLSVADPTRKGRDPVEVTAAKLSDDGRIITLTIPGLQPVMQMDIKLQLKSAEGAEIRTEIANTIHRVPE